MKCLIYSRVSTDRQVEKELSIPAQLKATRQYADQRGWQVVEEFVEPGASARTADRPLLHRLIARCRSATPKIDFVVVHKIDRLARNLADHIAIRAALTKAGAQLVSVTENLEDSVSGHLVENIMAALAEFYSANLSHEVLKGMTECVRRGGWPRGLPRGYVRSPLTRQAEPDPVVAPLIRFAFETVATGRYQLKIVCAWLAERGLRLKRNDLGRILRHPFYCGRVRWNGERAEGRHEALVSQELFDRVQVVLTDRRRRLERRIDRGPLHGLATCASCGAVVGSEAHKGYRYYRCRRSPRSENRCRAPYINATKLESQLAPIYRGLPITPDLRRAIRGAMAEERQSQAFDRQFRGELAASAVADRRTREQRLADALASGLMEPHVYRVAIERIRKEPREVAPVAPAPQTAWPLQQVADLWELHCRIDAWQQQ